MQSTASFDFSPATGLIRVVFDLRETPGAWEGVKRTLARRTERSRGSATAQRAEHVSDRRDRDGRRKRTLALHVAPKSELARVDRDAMTVPIARL